MLWLATTIACFINLSINPDPILGMRLGRFNKFTPLPAGALRDCLFALGERAGFRARAIQVMDGSKRSRHSNAFFTGPGRFRKIVLFDTLVQQLGTDELESWKMGIFWERRHDRMDFCSGRAQL
jgi:STE24 endopeptidase